MPREEIELKFKLTEPALMRTRLRGAGFRVAVRRREEANWIFDDGDRLRQQGKLLRLRCSGGRWLLTAKGPRRPGALKRRAESETPVADGDACRDLLELLGYREVLCYRRYRASLRRSGESGEVAWDETPLGTFLELEGTAAWVRRTARELGLDPRAAEPRSYPELYLAARLAGIRAAAERRGGEPKTARRPKDRTGSVPGYR